MTQQERDQLLNSFPRFYEWRTIFIDPSWIITVAHCGMTDHFTYNNITYQVQKKYTIAGIDVLVGELDKPFLDPQGHHLPLYRYRGSEEDHVVWIFGSSARNRPGVGSGPLDGGSGQWLVGTNRVEPFNRTWTTLLAHAAFICKFDTANSPHTTKYEVSMVGGDSGGPNVINIAAPKNDQALPKDHNDFWKNFRLCGINSRYTFSERGLPHGLHSGDTESIRLADPRIQNWLDNLIIARALGHDFPTQIPKVRKVPEYITTQKKGVTTYAERENMAIMIAPQWLIAYNDLVDHKVMWIRMSEDQSIPDQKVNIAKNLNLEHQSCLTDLKLIKLEKPVFPVAINKQTGRKELFSGYKRLSADPTQNQHADPHITQASVGSGTYLPIRNPSILMSGKGALPAHHKNHTSQEYFDRITVILGVGRTEAITNEVSASISNIIIKDALGIPF